MECGCGSNSPAKALFSGGEVAIEDQMQTQHHGLSCYNRDIVNRREYIVDTEMLFHKLIEQQSGFGIYSETAVNPSRPSWNKSGKSRVQTPGNACVISRSLQAHKQSISHPDRIHQRTSPTILAASR